RPTLRRYNSSLDALPDCEEHGEKLKLYCNECKVVCCTFCEIEGSHKDHKTLHIHEAEDLDKRGLCRLQQKVDEYGEKYIKSRSDVQKSIEETKRNDIRVQDLVRRYFRELKTSIDHGEKIILEEIDKRNKATLRSLNEQLSSMIEISSRAKTASRKCDEILSLDYFGLMDAKKDVENDVKNVLKMECKTVPCVSSKLLCQFPKHETLLNELRTCAKIVAVPDAPVQLSCKLIEPTVISVQWSPPSARPFIYPVQEYLLQSDTGGENGYIDLHKGSSTSVSVNTQDGSILGDVKCKPDMQMNQLQNRVQFRVAAINIVGQSHWSSPFAIRVPGQ
ncbi:E3 ubiquitin-protein ligase TRIM58-like, partial [Dendronephthya gigantea]|uniref:E3 ubiquitin-protein ligase TRIM58-like n=1 Tax=Dendronephthya gigantea TaxID=151771 RepID=UPI00106C5C9A